VISSFYTGLLFGYIHFPAGPCCCPPKISSCCWSD